MWKSMSESYVTVNNFELFDNNKLNHHSKKIIFAKWMKFKQCVSKKCTKTDNKDNSVYFETLSVASVKRTLRRIYRQMFKSQYNGYEKFLSDEERRLNYYVLDNYNMVEGI